MGPFEARRENVPDTPATPSGPLLVSASMFAPSGAVTIRCALQLRLEPPVMRTRLPSIDSRTALAAACASA